MKSPLPSNSSVKTTKGHPRRLGKRLSAAVITAGVVVAFMVLSPVKAAEPALPYDFAQLQQMQKAMGALQDFYNLIISMHQVAGDPEKAAILQMNQIEIIYRRKGQPDKAIATFRQVLKDTSNPTIRNAAYMKLTDALKRGGKEDEALTVLQQALKDNLARVK